MDNLGGKVAVVTGAASGIGLSLARAFASKGMHVVLADIEADALDAAVRKVGALGVDAHGIVCDVRDHESVFALRDAAYERFGAVHVVCNNAGVGAGGPVWTIDPARFKWVVDVDLLGVAYGIQAFVPGMIDQGEGHVVNTASAAGLLTGPGMAPYFAAKHGVVALSESLAFDLQLTGNDQKVGVSVLCPEWVRTRIHESERTRPADVPAAPEPTEGQVGWDSVTALITGGTDPDEIAAMVLDAVEQRRFYVIPHATTTIPHAQRRWQRIEDGGYPDLMGFLGSE